MVDRTPQQFPNGNPDGITDNTSAIQAAVDAWVPGDQIVIEGGVFRTTAPIVINATGLVIRGDGVIRGLAGFIGEALVEFGGHLLTIDSSGLELDAGDLENVAIFRTLGGHGHDIRGIISRGSRRAFLKIDGPTTDLGVRNCSHLGEGFGIVTLDSVSIEDVTVRGCTFEHPGSGRPGSGLWLEGSEGGSKQVSIVDCTARGYIGAGAGEGHGFAFAHITDGRLIACRAAHCASDGFHFERGAHRWVCADLRAHNIGTSPGSIARGSGFVAYDSDDIQVVLTSTRNCTAHGIALSGEGKDGLVPSLLRQGGRVERCATDTTGGDGIHVTAQSGFVVSRNWIRDPSSGNPGQYAGIHVGRQGATSLENDRGSGGGNVVVVSGATVPRGEIVVRAKSSNVSINGITGGAVGEPFADGTFWSDAYGWLEAA